MKRIALVLLLAAANAFAQDVRMDGSSTVYPVSLALAEEFLIDSPDARVTVAFSGTGAGFEKFCGGETDVSGASRVIKPSEIELCEQNGISFVELPVAADGLSVVVNVENDWAQCLTTEELNRIWRPDSDVTTWSDVRAEWPDQDIVLYGPGTDSGTFDYFTEAINGEEKVSRSDYQMSEDDNTLVQGVSGASDHLRDEREPGQVGGAVALVARRRSRFWRSWDRSSARPSARRGGRGRPPLEFRDDVEIKLLREFTPTHDWVLEPGDMLYLPPDVPHHGVAEDPCLTFSLGMRAPSVAELMGDYVDTLAAEADEALRYVDPDLDPAKDPHEIDADAMARVVEALNAVRMADADALGDWFGRFITVYRAAAGPGHGDGQPLATGELSRALDGGLVLQRYPWSRVAWRRAAKGARFYVAGQAWQLPVADARRLASAARVDAGTLATLSTAGRDCLAGLLAEGHYRLEAPDEETP